MVRHGLRLLRTKKVVSVDGLLNKMLAASAPFTPIWMRQAMNRSLMGTP